ncbi:lysoplasmalogenase [Facilibium subflavum]|uniref:lysoplasmalogenase n=1 Tax=Facilibium subflavum TaxID=2219058 RepID=UPI000E65CA43|nr:lysoplasmalogenase [Facilibium subflavum]
MWMLFIYTALIAIFAFIHIYTKYKKKHALSAFFKLLTTALIILYAGLFVLKFNAISILILIGLGCSIIGDAFLLAKTKFTHGLLAFLIAHLCYIAAFYSYGHTFIWWVFIIIIGYGVIFYCLLYYNLSKDKINVAVYIVIIALMVSISISNLIAYQNLTSLLMALGAIFFMASDSILAWDQFKERLKHEPVLVMANYYLAQWLIALSIVYFIPV